MSNQPITQPLFPEINSLNVTLRKSSIIHDLCPSCGKIAREKSTSTIEMPEDKPNKLLIFLECGHIIIKNLPKATRFESLVSNWWKGSTCEHEWSTIDTKVCVKCKETRLYPFQIIGAQFLEAGLASRNGAAVFDEMGLGKTIQALGYLKFHEDERPILFVVKSGIKFQWFKELLKWLGPSCIAQVIETSKDLIIPGLNCYIVSYDIFTKKERKMKKTGKISKSGRDYKEFDFIKTVIMDEVQQIKNPDSERTKEIRRLCEGKKVIALSGTPWKNRGSEFFTILNILAPTKFPTYQGFLDRWVDFYYDGEFIKQGGIKRVEEFKQYIADIAIRREVADVGIQMPDVNRTISYAELDDVEQKTYDESESDFVKWFNEFVIGGEEGQMSDMNILAQMSRMRHITGLAKIPATEEYVENFYNDTDRKLTIFVHHKDVGSILYDNLKKKYEPLGLKIYKLTGEMNSEERFSTAEAFQSSKRAFLIASTLASGEGINLQSCGDAILHERQWNPQNEDQAAPGRFRRIGSNHATVNVIFQTAAGTIDEVLADIVERKRAFFHNAMNSGEYMEESGKSLAMELAEGLVKNQKEKSKIARMASLPGRK